MTYNFNNGPSDAMSISGKWTNIHNGQEIFVRDSFIDGDNMIVRTIDGNIIPMTEFSNNYVQSEEVDEATARSVIQQPVAPQSYGDIKPDFGEKVILKNDDTKSNNIKPNNLDQASQHVENHKEDKAEDKLFRKKTLIGKIFEKISTKPNINLTFDWTEYPEKEMSMLMEYFDVSNDDIANYIYKTYFNENIIKESILKLIQKN